MAESTTKQRPIVQLTTQLANQIAAGEVVERPASVVKELLENSLDAGATQIDVEILQGGKQLIRVRDNGSGISKDQLALALAPHATSKIVSLEDLMSLHSFGFRGEALASISSVSRFRLTSKTAEQTQGWCAETEGYDMQVMLSPAPATVGTRIDVEELFHNTPARRRFLRTDKTEFSQIDTVIRQIALAHPQVTILLKHNQRLIKRYKAAFELPQIEQRVSAVIGTDFIQHAVRISVNHETLTLRGWIALPDYHRSQTDGQYFFVNNRPVKDKVLTHALREAYYPHLPEGRYASYVLFFELPAQQVDVNVHPTKHEVRFHDVRQVHDFIVQALEQSLHQGIAMTGDETSSVSQASENQSYKEPLVAGSKKDYRSYADFISAAYRTKIAEPQVNELSKQSVIAGDLLNVNNELLLFKNHLGIGKLTLADIFCYWLNLIHTDSQPAALIFPQIITSTERPGLEQLAQQCSLEFELIEGQVKLFRAPAAWHCDYLSEIISDYLLYKTDQASLLQLNWVTKFIQHQDLSSMTTYRSLSEFEAFFSAS